MIKEKDKKYLSLRWHCPFCNLNFHTYYSDKSVINATQKVFSEHMIHHIKICNKNSLVPRLKLTSI